ncbi:hypothetical protein [Vibrio taketomensis]|uniref:hypothetical protein n=1 Tax=Vibrio taketomensis TaxID=2572923 RepID=UPI001389DE11|nr:hypothetical protein [Vibrio taketomensis]
MNLQQCWNHYVKAEEMLKQGHWPEAQYLYDQVMHNMPTYIQEALQNQETKPCQFACLVNGYRDAAIAHSQILNHLGQQHSAFDTLNQAYALVQFISIESSSLVNATRKLLSRTSNDLLHHISLFCTSQRDANWMLELELLQKAQHYFDSHNLMSHHWANEHALN